MIFVGEGREKFHNLGRLEPSHRFKHCVDEVIARTGPRVRIIVQLKPLLEVPLGLPHLKLLAHAFDRLDEGWVAEDKVICLLVSQRNACVELKRRFVANLESLLRRLRKEMSPLSENGSGWLFLCEVDGAVILILLLLALTVLRAIGVYIDIGHALATKGATHFVLLELTRVPVDQLGPFVHLVPRLLVELLLVKVILLLELLRQFPDHVVFELEEFTLLLVMLEKHLALGQLTR